MGIVNFRPSSLPVRAQLCSRTDDREFDKVIGNGLTSFKIEIPFSIIVLNNRRGLLKVNKVGNVIELSWNSMENLPKSTDFDNES